MPLSSKLVSEYYKQTICSRLFTCFRYHLTLFYPKPDMTLPLAATTAAIMLAQVMSAPIAGVLTSLDGSLGLRGWQWLALVEGGMTVAVGLSLLWWLPPRPEAIKSLNGKELSYISSHVSRCVASVSACLGDQVVDPPGVVLSPLLSQRLVHCLEDAQFVHV